MLIAQCGGCHGVVGNANRSVGNEADTYNSLLNNKAKDNVSHYIVPNDLNASVLYQRVTHNSPLPRMPQGGPDLTVTDTDFDGHPDATQIQTWIASGAVGP